MNLTNKELVFNQETFENKLKTFEFIADVLVKHKLVENKSQVIKGLTAREEEMSTGLGDGIAIPHSVIPSLNEAKVIIIRNKKAMEWEALDKKPVDLIISILVPENGRDTHFDILTTLAANLVDPAVIEKFRKLEPKELADFVNEITSKISTKNENTQPKEEKKEDEPAAKDSEIFIVGVTTCPTGVAHTFMAAKAIEDEAKKRGWKVKVEKQGQMTKDRLTQKEIDEADYVLFAAGKGIDEIERFYGKNLYKTDVAEPITKAEKVLDDLIAKAKPFNDSLTSETKVVAKEEKKGFGQGPIRHLLSGISYMIPFIAMAGIVLGFTTAFGFTTGWINDSSGIIDPSITLDPGATLDGFTYGFGPKGTAARALNSVAGAGFTLFIPILGGYIAYSIAGRHAMAPAMIVSLFLNDSTGTALFNYSEGHFGDFGSDHPVALGFFGAIAAGYLIGYGVKIFTQYTDKVESRAFQTIVPLLIIPILWTIIPWVFFAFVGYIPLYGLGIGLQELISVLVDAQLLWIVGMLMGAMICFDLGGPVNKMAMVAGALFLNPGPQYFPLINGIAAVAVSIPPMVLLTTAFLGKFVGVRMDESDKVSATSAGIMGFFGITEGSIPFAAKNPKLYMPSFMIAGAIAGGIASFTGVGNSVALWGGPIIYIAGGMGHSPDIGGTVMQTDWVYSLLYFVPLIIGAFVGLGSIALLTKVYENKEHHFAKDHIEALKADHKEEVKAIRAQIKELDKNSEEVIKLKEKITKIKSDQKEEIERLNNINKEYFVELKKIRPTEKEKLNEEVAKLKKTLASEKTVLKEFKTDAKNNDNEKLEAQIAEQKEKIKNIKTEIHNLNYDFYNYSFKDKIIEKYLNNINA